MEKIILHADRLKAIKANKKTIVLGFIIALSFSTLSQDIQFSQFSVSALQLNPAFTGNTIQHRWIGVYRNQWPAISKAFVSNSFSYDNHLSRQNSGVGFKITQDRAGSVGLRFTNIGGLYSYYIHATRKLSIRFGTKLSYTFRNYDLSEFRFQDQIINGSTTSIENLNGGISYPDISIGTVMISEKFWTGLAIDHLNRPDQSFLEQESRLPFKFSIHGGYKFTLHKGDKNGIGGTYISSLLNYKAQKKWDQLDIGVLISKYSLSFGISYRGIPFIKKYKPGYSNNEAIIASILFPVNSLKIGYSYDITISELAGNTGGAHEISFVYEHYRKNKRRKRYPISCPKF